MLFYEFISRQAHWTELVEVFHQGKFSNKRTAAQKPENNYIEISFENLIN